MVNRRHKIKDDLSKISKNEEWKMEKYENEKIDGKYYNN